MAKTTTNSTRDLIVAALRKSKRLSRAVMHARLRYRADGKRELRALLADGTIIQVRDGSVKPGPRAVIYELGK
jgi:hypothetical protein